MKWAVLCQKGVSEIFSRRASQIPPIACCIKSQWQAQKKAANLSNFVSLTHGVLPAVLSTIWREINGAHLSQKWYKISYQLFPNGAEFLFREVWGTFGGGASYVPTPQQERLRWNTPSIRPITTWRSHKWHKNRALSYRITKISHAEQLSKSTHHAQSARISKKKVLFEETPNLHYSERAVRRNVAPIGYSSQA